MKKFVRVLLGTLAVIVAFVLVIVAVRFVNGLRYPTPPELAGNPQDPSIYPLDQPGLSIERVEGHYLNGYHLTPDAPERSGLVVVWGGSEGGPDYARGVQLAGQGYEVLSLFYFGQPHQPELLTEVPLEFFDEVLAWRATHAPEGPLTVLGTSKGAELALALQERYAEIDHVVVYTPTQYVWAGLDYARDASSWTWRGEPIPYVSFSHASGGTNFSMFLALLLNTPIHLRQTYVTAPEGDPDAAAAALIRLRSGLPVLAFAGTDDAMWPADDAVRALTEQSPDVEVHVLPGAGHLFGSNDGYAAGLALGGTRDANERAKAESDRILLERLSDWHPAA